MCRYISVSWKIRSLLFDPRRGLGAVFSGPLCPFWILSGAAVNNFGLGVMVCLWAVCYVPLPFPVPRTLAHPYSEHCS